LVEKITFSYLLIFCAIWVPKETENYDLTVRFDYTRPFICDI